MMYSIALYFALNLLFVYNRIANKNILTSFKHHLSRRHVEPTSHRIDLSCLLLYVNIGQCSLFSRLRASFTYGTRGILTPRHDIVQAQQ